MTVSFVGKIALQAETIGAVPEINQQVFAAALQERIFCQQALAQNQPVNVIVEVSLLNNRILTVTSVEQVGVAAVASG